MWLCMWKFTISEEILIRFLDYFNIFALCEQFWKIRILGPLLRQKGPLLVPFLLKTGSPLGPLFTIFGSPWDLGTVQKSFFSPIEKFLTSSPQNKIPFMEALNISSCTANTEADAQDAGGSLIWAHPGASDLRGLWPLGKPRQW